MTIFYLDPVGGNDANDGTTFANRWKTLTSGATAARIAPGDVIRTIASPDATSIGNATWTDNSGTIAIAAQKNKVVEECESGWTAATNITVAHNTSQKTGSARLNLTPAAGFTTGLAAYKAFGSAQDFSGYQQITLWFQTSTGAAQSFSVVLCSDAAGATPVDTLSVSALANTANVWRSVVLDKGSALSAGINSVAIYVDVDPGTAQLRFDNIVACKAPGSADEITHRTLIGKNTVGEPEWYNLEQITDAGVVVGGSTRSFAATHPPRPYRGTTETIDTKVRQALPAWVAADRTLNESGTDGSPITFSGGWNRTDMSTQTGETWVSGGHFESNLFTATSRSFHNWDTFGLCHFDGTAFNEIGPGCDIDLVSIIGCNAPVGMDGASSFPQFAKFVCQQIWACHTQVVLGSGNSASVRGEIGRIHGFPLTTVASGAFSADHTFSEDIRVGRIDNNAAAGIYVNGVTVKLAGAVLENNSPDIYFATSAGGECVLDGCTLSSSTKITAVSSAAQYALRETNISGDPTLHKTTEAGGSWESQSAVTFEAGLAWKESPTTANHNAARPLMFPLARMAVNANKLVTIKCQVRRTNTALSAGLRLKNKALPGIAETTVLMTAAADTWEEVTITGTPTTAGVLTVFGAAYGGTTYSAYFDKITITQAD